MTTQIGGTTGITFPDSSTQNTAATGFGFKNRIINGAMMIDQRNAGASGTAIAYTLDRWQYNATQASKLTWQQNAGSVTTPAGFANYLGITSSSAYSVLTGDTFYLCQRLEGFNTADLAWGTSAAATVTLSFRVYSSLTGTFGGSIFNQAGTRSYPFNYTVSSANTWTTVSVTIPGDTSGTWVGATNAASIVVAFGLGSGSTYSGTAGAWASGIYIQPTGSVSVVGTNGATFYITGVQLEKGSTATSFDYRPFGTELQLCQRYYEKSFDYSNAPADGTYASPEGGGCTAFDNNNARGPMIVFAVQKRATPTINYYSPGSATTPSSWRIYNGGWISTTTGTTASNTYAFSISMTGTNIYTAAGCYLCAGFYTASAEL